jgi:UDP-glucose 4-epimerase
MILIVGGAGYIGSHVNKLLSERGYQTIIFDNLSKGHHDFVKWGTFVQGDLANTASLAKCFQDYPISAVMHFSAFIEVGESVQNPARYYQNNVSNTLNLLKTMLQYHVNHFIFSSTCAVYGPPQYLPLDEKHPINPLSPYAKSKHMVESILQDFDTAYGLKSICLRYFNAAGADIDLEIGERHHPESHLIPLAIQAALGIKPNIKIFGTNYPTKDGTCVRDYIHVTDLSDAHIKALEHLQKNQNSDVFNLANSQGFSVREIIQKVQEISQKTITTITTSARPGDAPTLIGNNLKAKEILLWQPKYEDINQIIKSALAWHQQDLNAH